MLHVNGARAFKLQYQMVRARRSPAFVGLLGRISQFCDVQSFASKLMNLLT